jgi:hypothetical protein
MPYSRTPIWSKTWKASMRTGPRQTTSTFNLASEKERIHSLADWSKRPGARL